MTFLLLVLLSPMTQATNSFSPPKTEPSTMIEKEMRMIFILKKMQLLWDKALKSTREPQQSQPNSTQSSVRKSS